MDSAYISVAGIWAASCDEANIRLARPYNAGADDGANLVIAGGTIFNGGAISRGRHCHYAFTCPSPLNVSKDTYDQ